MLAPVAVASDHRTPFARVVVELSPELAPAGRAGVLAANGLTALETIPGTSFVLAEREPGTADPAPGAGIISITPVRTLAALGAPNDPLYPRQWNLQAVQAADAWDLATGVGVVVAVVDTGVARGAPDLAGTRFVAGYDWVDDDQSPDDENGHGTHVVGTIAQTTNNGIGGAGLAPGATIMPLRVLDADGAGSDFDTALAIHFAVDHGASVVNLSLGGTDGSPVLEESIRYAAARNVLVVAAAGNDHAATLAFPAAYDDVLAVGAVGLDRTRAPYSNTGIALDVVAPGGDLSVDRDNDGYGDGVLQQTISTTAPGGFCYCFFQGTSMAAPHVAATAALLASSGMRDRREVAATIVATAADLGPPGPDPEYGAGLVQAGAALRSARPAAAPAPAIPSGPAPAVPTPEAPGIVPLPQDIERACPEERVPRDRFDDVDPSSVHSRAVECAAFLGVASGDTSGRYHPGAGVTRDQMASFVARMIERTGRGLPVAPPDAFDDDDGNTHEHRINQLAAVGVVQGSTSRRYAPRQAVTRAAMATILARTYDTVADETLRPAGDYFDDDAGMVHEEQIDRVAAEGIATGTGVRRYTPQLGVRRDQLATFLVRTYAALLDAGDAPRP